MPFTPPNMNPFAPKVYSRLTGGGIPVLEPTFAPLVISHAIALTQAQYDALPSKETDVLYIIRG